MIRSYSFYNPASVQPHGDFETYSVYVDVDRVSVYHRRWHLDSVKRKNVLSPIRRWTFQVVTSVEGVQKVRVFTKSGRNGAIFNYAKEVLYWSKYDILGNAEDNKILYNEVKSLLIRNGMPVIHEVPDAEYSIIASVIYPALDRGLISFADSSLGAKSWHRLVAANPLIPDALQATTVEEWVRKSFHPSWIVSEADVRGLKKVDLWWYLGAYDFGVPYSEMKDLVSYRSLDHFESAYERDLTLHIIAETPVEKRVDLLNKILRLRKNSHRKEVRSYQVVSTQEKFLNKKQYRDLFSHMSDRILNSEDGLNFTQFAKRVFNEWYSKNILATYKVADSADTYENIFYVECEKYFGMKSDEVSSQFVRVHEDYDLFTLPNVGKYNFFSLFGGLKAVVSQRGTNLLSQAVHAQLGDTGLTVSFTSTNSNMVSSFEAVMSLRILTASINDQLLRMGLSLTPENRLAYWSLPLHMRDRKVNWKYLGWGVTNPNRIMMFKEARITRKADVQVMNDLPDHMLEPLLGIEPKRNEVFSF